MGEPRLFRLSVEGPLLFVGEVFPRDLSPEEESIVRRKGQVGLVNQRVCGPKGEEVKKTEGVEAEALGGDFTKDLSQDQRVQMDASNALLPLSGQDKVPLSQRVPLLLGESRGPITGQEEVGEGLLFAE